MLLYVSFALKEAFKKNEADQERIILRDLFEEDKLGNKLYETFLFLVYFKGKKTNSVGDMRK